MKRRELSVVVPVYGCAGCLQVLYERLCRSLERISEWEVVFVDDASRDGAWDVLESLAAHDDRVRALRLSRNFGQHAAITAGLADARGHWVAVMDCDLQDPPEEIPGLLARAREGYDVVLTEREQRKQTWHRRLMARSYFRVRNMLLGQAISAEHSTLSVISRSVVDAFLALGDRDRQYILILDWLGFRRLVVPLRHGDRHEGRSAYTWSRLLQVAVDGMFFQTTRLLRWIVYLGFLVAFAGALLAAVFIGLYFTASALPGFTSLAVLILLVGGFILVSTGITGLYIGKIFEQVKGRPLYVVERRTTARERPLGGELSEPTRVAISTPRDA